MLSQEIKFAVGGNQPTTTAKRHSLRDNKGKAEVETGSCEVLGSCKSLDWKDELKDIQAARVEQEVARLQRTIEETQRRWETYARHGPVRGTSTLSDGSTEHLHHPRPESYLVPLRNDLWRTVSEDTISVPLREATPQQPLLRHTSMDSLRPNTKVSNIHSLAHQPHQSTTSINSVGSSSIDGPSHPPNHSPMAHLGRSMESVGGYSDRDALDSDGSLHTPEESPSLPSVKKLASRFDQGPQKVNNLDKHGKNNSVSHSGKNIQSSGRVPLADRASYTNNLNKRNEKPYTMKEVRSLAEVPPPSDPDTHSSDGDNWEFDDSATVTSMSLPPTPVSLSNKYSFSASSLIDTDSSSVFDSKDPDTPKSFFGVTLRKTNRSSPVHVYSRKRDSTSDEASNADHREMAARRLSSRSLASVERMQTPSSSEEDTPATLRQSTIIKVAPTYRYSVSDSQDLAPVRKFTKSNSLANLYQHEDQSLQNSSFMKKQNSASTLGYAFAPKGKRSMSSFLKAYTKHKSLHDIHQIDEKAEENFSIQRVDDDYLQPRFQDQKKNSTTLSTNLRKAKSEKSLTSIDYDSKNKQDSSAISNSKKAQPPQRIHQPTAVNGHVPTETPHKSTSTTSTPEGSFMASVAVVTTPGQQTFSDGETATDTEKSEPKVVGHSSEENESTLESHQNDKEVTATVVYCTGEEPSEVTLNEAHVSAFQEQLKMESQQSVGDSSSSSSNDGGQVANGEQTMRRHRSVGDLLKAYSNIKSLDGKKDSAPIVSSKKDPVAESTEPYKTIIAVEDSPEQASPKIRHSHQTKPSTSTNSKPKPAPVPMKKTLSHSYFMNVDQKAEKSHTVISVPGKKSAGDNSNGEVFHASTIYVGDNQGDSHPDYSTRITVNGRASPPFRGEVTVNEKYVLMPSEPQTQSSGGWQGSQDNGKQETKKNISDTPDSVITTVEVNDTFVRVKKEETSDSSNVKVVSVTKKAVKDVDDSATEDLDPSNPMLIKKLIMQESRTGKSGITIEDIARKNEKLKDASVPLNSPFSPLRSQLRKKSSSSTLSPSEEVPPKLANQDSQDEGVDFPSDTPPSASSQDPAGPEGCQPRV